jgi:tRNA U54 and U55 pseudouridine synthase Pus10
VCDICHLNDMLCYVVVICVVLPGREDRNVRMVGPGRPFYLHIKNARTDKVELDKIRMPENGAVQVQIERVMLVG